MKKSSAAQGARSVLDNYRVVAIACVAGLVIMSLTLLLAAFVISSVDVPQSAISPIAIAAAVLGSFGAGFICTRMTKGGGLLYGLICGLVIFVLATICEVSFLNGSLGILALYKLIISVTAAMIGGVMGVNRRRKIRR